MRVRRHKEGQVPHCPKIAEFNLAIVTAADRQRYRSEEEKMQHAVPLYPWHEGVASGIMQNGRHMSCDGVQVDMPFFDLGDPKKSIDALLELMKLMVDE